MIKTSSNNGINLTNLRKRVTITPTRLKGWAKESMNSLEDRMAAGRNIHDAPSKPYSTKGPIYIPVTGLVKGRSKQSLGGVPVLTRSDLRTARKAGWRGGVGSSGKTIKFDNYAAYKQFLGKPGYRDWELSGAMKRAIGVVAQTEKSITIGFLSEEQLQKMKGNNAIDPTFGLSPADLKTLRDFVSEEIRR